MTALQPSPLTHAPLMPPPPTGLDEYMSRSWMDAGIIIGSVDWLVEAVTGWSMLEELVYKPLGGDWSGMERAAEGWRISAETMRAVVASIESLPESVNSAAWTGESREAWERLEAQVGTALANLPEAMEAMGQLATVMGEFAKSIADFANAMLRDISYILAAALIINVVPVAGQVASAAKVTAAVGRAVYGKYQMALLAVSVMDRIEALVKLMELVEDVITALQRIWQMVDASRQVHATTNNLSPTAV